MFFRWLWYQKSPITLIIRFNISLNHNLLTFYVEFFKKGHDLCVDYFHSTWKTADECSVMAELHCLQFMNRQVQIARIEQPASMMTSRSFSEWHLKEKKNLWNSICRIATRLWKMAPPSPWEKQTMEMFEIQIHPDQVRKGRAALLSCPGAASFHH